MAGINSKSKLSIILKNIAFPLVILAAGGIAVIESNRLTHKYPQDNWFAGPSGFMMIIGIILLILFTIELFKSIKTTKKDIEKNAEVEKKEKTDEEKGYVRDMIISFLMVCIYILIIKYAGFALASTIYLVANLILLKNPKLRIIITAIVIFLLLLYGAPLAGISLPRGYLGF